jgi:hypothetical protein
LQKQKGFNLDDVLLPRSDGTRLRLGDVTDDFNKQLDTLRKSANAGPQAQKDKESLQSNLKTFYETVVNPLVIKFPELSDEGTKAFGAVRAETDSLTDSLNKAADAAARLRDTLKQAQPGENKLGLGVVDGEDVAYASTGGYMHPGKPRGSDIIPAWLTPGEFVVNAKDTRRFYSQLLEINSGRQPKYYNHGGYVTTNIGDVHVHMSGAGAETSPTRTARVIGAELRREMRRGNFTLGRS